MVSTTVLTESALSIGYKAYNPLADASRSTLWQGVVQRLHKLRSQVTGGSTPTTVDPVDSLPHADQLTPTLTQPITRTTTLNDLTQAENQTIQQQLLIAAGSLGVAATAVLYYPPLRAVCVPALLCLGITPAHRAYQALRHERRVTVVLAETVAITLCIAQGYYLVGSLGFTMYYLGQIAAGVRTQEISDQSNDERHKPGQERVAWQPPIWAWRQDGAEEVVTPVNNLRVGDIVVVHTGEMIPVSGVVTTGMAWVRPKGHASHATHDEPRIGVKVNTGDIVGAADIVLVGRICVTVTVLY